MIASFKVQKTDKLDHNISVNLSFLFLEQCANVGGENLRSDLRRKVHNTRSAEAEYSTVKVEGLSMCDRAEIGSTIAENTINVEILTTQTIKATS